MKGWGAQDDFQEQIKATVDDRMAYVRHQLSASGLPQCEDCDEEIPAPRRLAYPAATRCVKCQTQFERR